MALPTSRDETATAAGPVHANLVNKLQDCVIGFKFPALEYDLHASAFVKIGGAGTLGVNSEWNGVLTQATVPIWLPVGTLIESITYYYNRAGAGNVTLGISSRNFATLGTSAFTLAVINAGTGFTSTTRLAADLTTAGIAPVIPTGLAYWLTVTTDNAAHVFAGVKITASRL